MKKYGFVVILVATAFLISGCAQAIMGAAEVGFAAWGTTEKAKIEEREKNAQRQSISDPLPTPTSNFTTPAPSRGPTNSDSDYEKYYQKKQGNSYEGMFIKSYK